MKPFYLLLAFMLLLSGHVFCQAPPQVFFDGLNQLDSNKIEAKNDFLTAIKKDPRFYGSYHFLGVIYLDEKQLDSAVWYFKTSIALNTADVNHTREMSYVRLINTFIQQQDFRDAFDWGWEAYKQYADNETIGSVLKSACLWSFYIKYDHLDPSYILPGLKKEYVVNSISEEYLILREIRIDDEYLDMNSQSLAERNGAYYDVFNCVLSNSKKPVEVDFKINWDMNKYIGEGNVPPTQPVIDDTKNPVYERLGAMLVADYKTDIKTAVENLTRK